MMRPHESPLSPDVGDVVFHRFTPVRLGGTVRFKRLRVGKVTSTQLVAFDVNKRAVRYWRKNGYVVGEGYQGGSVQLLEPKGGEEISHERGRPLPNDEELGKIAARRLGVPVAP